MTSIDGLYENIYNKLDSVLVLINLCNCIEVIGYSSYIKDDLNNRLEFIRHYGQKIANNSMTGSDILKAKHEGESDKPISLSEKLLYFSIVNRKKEFNQAYFRYISRINRTRNFFVHGNNDSNIFLFNEIKTANELLKCILFYTITYICNENHNLNYYITKIDKHIISIEEYLGLFDRK